MGELNAATNAVAGRIEVLVEKLEEAGQPPELLDELRAIAGTLNGLARDPADPVPAADAG